jgi:hypothetical protein
MQAVLLSAVIRDRVEALSLVVMLVGQEYTVCGIEGFV